MDIEFNSFINASNNCCFCCQAEVHYHLEIHTGASDRTRNNSKLRRWKRKCLLSKRSSEEGTPDYLTTPLSPQNPGSIFFYLILLSTYSLSSS